MSNNCYSQNPLVRDGTSQQQRLLKTLLPSYIPVDERSMKDLVAFARKFTGEINYFESDSLNPDSQWEGFFKITDKEWEKFSFDEFIRDIKKTGETAPHMALFLGFLYMFKTAQDDLNTLTRRHLDFYYREVLQLREKPAVSDQVAVIFKLARHTDQYLVSEGTGLKAGKDPLGVERIYRVTRDMVVSMASITSLKAVYADINDCFTGNSYRDTKVGNRIYQSPVANSADGLGADIETEEKSWHTFGEPRFSRLKTSGSAKKQPDRDQAEVGFAIASPILFMAEGERSITLTIALGDRIRGDIDAMDLNMLLSGGKGWISAKVAEVSKVSQRSANVLSVTGKLSPADPPVVSYDREILEDPFVTDWPVLKLVLSPDQDRNMFTDTVFKGLKANNITITIDVRGVKNLVLQNDQSVLDAGKPFLLFGNRPYKGSNFYIGSWEVFQKKPDSLNIHFNWNDLPQHNNGFEDHYEKYDDQTNDSDRSNDKFKIDIDILGDNTWHHLRRLNLFTDSEGNAVGDNSKLPDPDFDRSKLIVLADRGKTGLSGSAEGNQLKLIQDKEKTLMTDPDSGSQLLLTDEVINRLSGSGEMIHRERPQAEDLIFKREYDLKQFNSYKVKSQRGFVRISLKNQDFGHKAFPNSYADKAIRIAGGDDTAKLPNPPYTPTISDLSIDYKSSQDFSLVRSESSVEQFFHIEPFGAWQINTEESGNYLMPGFEHEGSLYIGLTDLQPPGSLSVLFQVAEGSANPVKTSPRVQWSYLSGNQWKAFDDKTILFDTTNGLLTSGIIRFVIPKDATKNNSRLPAGQHWIKVSVTRDPDAISRLIDVKAQAVLARFEDQGNDAGHLKQPLEPETIGKLLKSDSFVESVMQPYASFGGEMKEQQSDFYTRTSERLRHKQRAVSIWDYERIILQRFPSVYKVKCVNHTRFEGDLANYSELAPGHVTCIVVSNVQNQNAVDPLRPMTSLSTLKEIHSYMTTIISGGVILHVKNPVYEDIKVDFSVKFRSPDTGFYEQKLQKDIKEFVSPWSSGCSSDITFSGRIHKSMIINFVEERPYVDYITCFKMYHIVSFDPDNNPNKDVDEAKATTAVSILGSANEHQINAIDFSSKECKCEDNIVERSKGPAPADDCPCQKDITSLPEE